MNLHVLGEVVFAFHVPIEAMRSGIKVKFLDATDETLGLQVLPHLL